VLPMIVWTTSVLSDMGMNYRGAGQP